MPLKRVFLLLLIVVPIIAIVSSIVIISIGDVNLTVDLSLQGNRLVIEGETNLPNRAVISYEVAPANEQTRLREGSYAAGVAVVGQGEYRVEVDTTLFPPGDVTVWIRFEVSPETPWQPPSIVAKYGKYGDKIRGSNRIQEGRYTRIELSESIQIRHASP